MNVFPPRSIVERLRLQYPAGQRIELVSMNDPYTRLRPIDQGTVRYVDDIGTVHIAWDNGSSLGAAYGEDEIRKLPGIVKDGRWYAATDGCCPRCGGPVYQSDIPEYTYQCFDCDEDFYSFEVTTYGCDMCGCRKNFDHGIVWITTSYGVCEQCYDKLSEEELEKLRVQYE